jgi:hypothetical protein
MARLSASIIRDFTVPATDLTPSPHGSQREDAIIALYLPGWCREASPAAKAAFLPGVDAVAEGNGRGRGATGVDIFRPNPSRAAGGDFGGLKAPKVREDGTAPTSVELFHGTRETATALLRAVAGNHRSRKAFPVAVVHTSGGTFAPRIEAWCVRDFGTITATATNAEAWPTWNGVPVKPVNDRRRGAGGSPASVWVQFERREYLGDGKARYIPDPDGNYVRISASFSKRSGAVFKTGTPQEFAADVDAATVLR